MEAIVGGILGIVFLAGIIACFCRWKCKKRSMPTGVAAPSQTPVTNSNTTMMGFPMLQMGQQGLPTGLPNGWQSCIKQAQSDLRSTSQGEHWQQITPLHDTQIPAALEMGTLATSVNARLVFDDFEVVSA